MKVNLNVDECLPILTQLASIAGSSKNAMPILDDILVQTNGGRLYLTASDGENVLSVLSPVIECEDGINTCVDAKNLSKAIGNLSGKLCSLDFDLERKQVTCTYDNGFFNLPLMEWEQFPKAADVIGDNVTEKTVDTKHFLSAIKNVSFAAATDEIRPIMNGVRVDFTDGGMVSVATDSRKLAKYTDLSVMLEDGEQAVGITIPKRAVNIMQNVLSLFEDGELVKLSSNEKFVIAKNKNFKLASRLIEGRYPDYNRVIPNSNGKKADVDKTSVISALKRVLTLSNKTSELVRLKFTKGQLTMSCDDIDFSRYATENLSCQYDLDEEFEIGFKGSFLLQVLQNVDSDDILLEFEECNKPCVVKPSVRQGDTDYVSIIMPLQL